MAAGHSDRRICRFPCGSLPKVPIRGVSDVHSQTIPVLLWLLHTFWGHQGCIWLFRGSGIEPRAPPNLPGLVFGAKVFLFRGYVCARQTSVSLHFVFDTDYASANSIACSIVMA